MKIKLTHSNDGWRWALIAGNGKLVAESGEAYKQPQKLVQTVNRYIVRDDADLAVALEKALHRSGFDEVGNQL